MPALSPRKSYLLTGGVVVALAIGVAVLGVRFAPRFEGRTVRAWVQSAAFHNEPQATNVLNRVPSEFIPELCRLAEGRPTFLDWSLQSLTARMPPAIRWQPPNQQQQFETARMALRVLAVNPQATNHVPALLRVVARSRGPSEETVRLAFVCQRFLKQEPAPHVKDPVVAGLVEGVAHANPWIQYYSISSLGRLGPSASNALPVLKTRLAAPGRTVAQHAAWAIWRVSGEREIPLQVLLVSLTSNDSDVLQTTARYLAQLAPQAFDLWPGRQVLLEENRGRPELRPRDTNLPGTCGRPGLVTLAYFERFAGHSDPVLARAARAARDQVSPPR